MNAQTRLSAKGQIVIPKNVRDRLRWEQGQSLEVIETADGVFLKKQPLKKKTLTLDEALVRIRARNTYNGPPVSIEEMNETLSEMFKLPKDERF